MLSHRSPLIRDNAESDRGQAVAGTIARSGQTGRVLKTIPVGDPDDPRLADYTRLTDISLRISLEAAHGLFIAEGTKVIGRAVRSGYPVRSMLLAQSRGADLDTWDGLEQRWTDRTCPPTSCRMRWPSGSPGTGCTGARWRRCAGWSFPAVGDVLAGASRIVVLEDLVDHGNVGAIFRCAAALDIDAVILSPRCADPLYRRSVKVSMGAVFAIPYSRMTDWRDGLAELRAAGFTLLALTPDEGATPIAESFSNLSGPQSQTARAGLLLGTEGDGLSSRWLHEADAAVRIPMSPAARAAGVDSLNVVAAAAIACNLLAQLPKSYDREGELRRLITEDCDARCGPGREAALSISENQDAATHDQPVNGTSARPKSGHGGTGLGSVEAEQTESGKRVPAAAKWGMAGLLLVYTGLGSYALISTVGSSAGPGHPEGVTRSVALALGKSAAPSRAGSATAPGTPAAGSDNLWGQLANIKSASGAAAAMPAAAAMSAAPARPAAPSE